MEAKRRRRVFRTLSRMQVTGSTSSPQTPQWKHESLHTVADLPAPFASSLDVADTRDYESHATFHGRRQSFVVLLRELYKLLDGVSQDRRKLRLLLQELVQRLLDPNGVHAEEAGPIPSESVGRYVAAERETFLRLGGDECLLRVLHALRLEDAEKQPKRRDDIRTLWETPVPVTIAPAKSGTDASLRKHALNDTMAILRELCYFSVNLAVQLCDKDGLVVYLFQLMGDVRFFDNASGLVEEILAVRDEAFDLTRVLMQSLSSRQLAFFCRVLALVVFEPEDRRLLETAKVVILNLVDSNVFIRSMLLSSEKFAKQPESGTFGMADDYEMDRMSEFLTVNLVRLLRDLMTIVTMDDINHENICCLNTAIVILVFQHRRKRLPAILEALRDHEDVSGKQGYVCDNFRGLLWFWIQYYTPRGRDRLGLEHSSEVKFEEWRHVVSLLCADDGSETALLSTPARLPPSPYSRLYATHRERRS
ncbi:hypothetical protein AM588_10005387 [Phytophthora nicotianae]|uniref:Uncharacterized protein n=1 Tax=Phytophthora nicotianae TaxID=4792 RepID=A0A0W8DGD8_PHYNI|nr:hypothetical protein AM588_10005387 [Phytophthora nicotianae]